MHLSVKVVESGAKAGEEQQTKSKSIALASEAEKDAFRSSPPSLPGDGDPCPGLLGESSHGTAGEETGCRGRPRASCVALAGGPILNHQQQAIPGEDLRLRPPARTASPYQPQWTTGRIRYTEASHNLLTTGSQWKLILPPLAGAWKLRREGKLPAVQPPLWAGKQQILHWWLSLDLWLSTSVSRCAIWNLFLFRGLPSPTRDLFSFPFDFFIFAHPADMSSFGDHRTKWPPEASVLLTFQAVLCISTMSLTFSHQHILLSRRTWLENINLREIPLLCSPPPLISQQIQTSIMLCSRHGGEDLSRRSLIFSNIVQNVVLLFSYGYVDKQLFKSTSSQIFNKRPSFCYIFPGDSHITNMAYGCNQQNLLMFGECHKPV